MENLKAELASDLDGTFPSVVSRLGRGVYSGLLQLTGDHHQAEDLSQEAFIRAYGALKNYPAERILALRLPGWVWTIALNLLRNHIRAQGRRPVPARLEEAGYIPPEPPDTDAWRRRWALLSEAQRTAVILRHVVGLSYQEMAQATGRPPNTLRSDVHRGLANLRSIIQRENLEEET